MSKSGKYNNAFEATWNGIVDMFRTRERVEGLGPEDRLDGKTVLVSGASKGLGFASTVALARLGARVIMGCRSGIPEKGQLAKELSGSDAIEMLQIDLSDFNSIDSFIEQLSAKKVRLDIVICNAAVVPAGSRKTPQGLEEMFVVNYLSKFYLVNRLIEDGHLERSNGIPRIIFVSSESHRNPEGFDWDGFGQYREYKMKEVIGRYGYFKLLMTTFARELARRHSSSSALPLEVRALCPGPVDSSIAREAPAAFQPLLKLVFSIFFKSPQDACEPVVYFAARQQEDVVPFDYLYLMSKRPIDPMAEDEDNGRRLWSVSESLIRDTHIHA